MTQYDQDDINNLIKNIKLNKPLSEPVHNFSMFFMPMREFYISFDKRLSGIIFDKRDLYDFYLVSGPQLVIDLFHLQVQI